MHIKRMNLKQMTIIAKLRVLPITKNLDVSHKRVKLEESNGIVTRKQALLIIDFQGNTRKGSSTSLSVPISSWRKE